MLALGVLSFFLVALQAQQCPPWTFDDSLLNGPSHWADLCPQYSGCRTGLAQSPINIVFNNEIVGHTSNLKNTYHPIQNFVFGNEDFAFEGRNFTQNQTLSFVGYGDFILQDFHLHAPSEHYINGVQFPLELHFVHLSTTGKYAVLTLLYENSLAPGATNEFLSTLAPYVPNILIPNSFVKVPRLDYSAQINTQNGFYHYKGSTTFPPCVPDVEFFVASSPIPVDPELLKIFTSELDNVRPLQPLNNRTITLYNPGHQQPTPHYTIQWALGVGIGGLIGVSLARCAYVKYKKSKMAEDMELDALVKKIKKSNFKTWL